MKQKPKLAEPAEPVEPVEPTDKNETPLGVGEQVHYFAIEAAGKPVTKWPATVLSITIDGLADLLVRNGRGYEGVAAAVRPGTEFGCYERI